MYSMVVLMALSGSAEAQDFGRGCRGCSGCCGVSSCHGCYSSCHGCRGRSCHGCRGCHGYSSCHGCTGCCGGCGGVIIKSGHASIMYPASGTSVASVGTGARIEINLPTAGQVVIDDFTVPHTSTQHTYITSSLGNGEKRDITLKAGNVTKKITVTAGQTLKVDMTDEKGGIASK